MHNHYYCQKSRNVATMSGTTGIEIYRYRRSTKCVSFEHNSLHYSYIISKPGQCCIYPTELLSRGEKKILKK